jgi:[citrate (pro-3S)-lyase] ligase
VDLEIFARYIAPQLGITIRFVGEEPIDKVTRQYNGQMKEILKDFDIEVEEIPRKQCNGEVISASKVRQFVKENNWEMVRQFVPETTYEYLKG